MTEHNQRLKDLSEIGIVIDTWDDIFLDFDPSPMPDRTLSVDFIDEVKKRYRERCRKNVILTVYAPESLASTTAEQIVIERIREYFDDRLRDVKEDRAKEIRRGILFCAVGFFVLAAFGAIEHYATSGPCSPRSSSGRSKCSAGSSCSKGSPSSRSPPRSSTKRRNSTNG